MWKSFKVCVASPLITMCVWFILVGRTPTRNPVKAFYESRWVNIRSVAVTWNGFALWVSELLFDALVDNSNHNKVGDGRMRRGF